MASANQAPAEEDLGEIIEATPLGDGWHSIPACMSWPCKFDDLGLLSFTRKSSALGLEL